MNNFYSVVSTHRHGKIKTSAFVKFMAENLQIALNDDLFENIF